MSRLCQIETASIELENGAGDGAYDLLDVVGSPEEVGRAIQNSLEESDLFSGNHKPSVMEAGGDLYLNVRIKFTDTGKETFSIFEYFVAKLGLTPGDETLKNLPYESVCGKACAKAIDAAKQMMEACGHETDDLICKACYDAVEVYNKGAIMSAPKRVFDVYRAHADDADEWLGWIEAETAEEALKRAEEKHQSDIDEDEDGYNPGGWVKIEEYDGKLSDLLDYDEYA